MSAKSAPGEEAKAFLPQFAAHAVADLEKTVKTVRAALKRDPARAQLLAQQQGMRPGVFSAYLRASEFLAQVIREAVHLYLAAHHPRRPDAAFGAWGAGEDGLAYQDRVRAEW